MKYLQRDLCPAGSLFFWGVWGRDWCSFDLRANLKVTPAFVSLIMLCIISFLWTMTSHAKIIERVVAVVNDEVILLSDVSRFRQNLQNGGLLFEELLQLRDLGPLKKSQKSQVDHLIDEKIVDSEVKRQNLQVTIERVEQQIRNMARAKGVTRSQLKKLLEEGGIKFSEYQNFVRLSLGRKSLIEKEIISKIKISDEEISTYYISKTGHGEGQAFEYRLAHILFSPDKGGDRAAKARAEKVHKLLKETKGVNFAKLASQYSEDPHFSNEGLLGDFKSGEMRPTFEDSVRDLSVGSISKIVKTGAGYHIIKLLNKTLVADPNLKRQKERISEILMAREFKKSFASWLQQKRKESFVRINVNRYTSSNSPK